MLEYPCILIHLESHLAFTIPLINCCTIVYNMVFNYSEARSQKYR